MGARSPGGYRIGASRRTRKPTTSNKRHRFEPFTKRIAQLRIDPVHTVARTRPSNNDGDVLQSYFHTSLEGWSELNLSPTFASFLVKASPLCENLPQLLHHADAIFEILVDHIEKRDDLSLEPLLGLLAQLAHDLDHGFEPYFPRAVQLAAEIAATKDKHEVVEWGFNCLAYIFKYLSRLLVQDLRPLLDVMLPYLSNKKDYVVRFSAESLSYLLKKAAMQYPTDKGPLRLALKHLLKGLPQQDGVTALSSYQLGVMSLCVESARGVDLGLHSCAPYLIQCLLDCALPMSRQAQVQSTVDGVLVGLMKETTTPAFSPALAVVLDAVQYSTISEDASQLSFALRLLFVVIGIEGEESEEAIRPWKIVIEAFRQVAEAAWRLNEDRTHINSVLAIIIATILQHAPLSELCHSSSNLSQQFLDSVEEHFSPREFYAFSTACAELGKERFIQLVLPRLQEYISKHWSEDEVSLYYMLERLQQNKIGFGVSADSRSISCPADLGDFILNQLPTEEQDEDTATLEQLAGRLRFFKTACLFGDSDKTAKSLDSFHNLLIHVLKDVRSDLDLRQRTVLGWGFDTYVEIAPPDDQRLKDLVSLIPSLSPVVFHLPAFVHAVCRLFRKMSEVDGVQTRLFDNVRQTLLQNLLSTSLSLKKGSAELLLAFRGPNDPGWLKETIRLILDVLNTAYTPAEARRIAYLLRRLLQAQKHIPEDSSFQDMIPYFLFGLVPHYHDRTRTEVCHVLNQMTQTTPSEETIVNVALQWLQSPVDLTQASEQEPLEPKSTLSSFECSVLAHLDSLSSSVSADFERSTEKFRNVIEDEHRLENPIRAPHGSRSLALQVLAAMPGSAERRSRLLVPVFLAAPLSRAHMQPKPSSDASMSSHTLSPDLDDQEWSLKDRKAILALFGDFWNPSTLFRSSEVHEKLTDLLSNGNDDIRKLALQAILTWKDPVLSRHEAMLLKVAEGNSEASVLEKCLTTDERESLFRQEDRSTALPVVLRLLFGIIVGRSGTYGSQDARRKSLLRVLVQLPQNEVPLFLDIALGKLRDVKVQAAIPNLASLDQAYIPEDQQYGFLRLLLSMLEVFQTRFAPYGQQVVDAVVFCVIKASRQGQTAVKQTSTGGLSRSIRRTGFQCLVLLFDHCQGVDWPVYLRSLFADAISPRLEIFASEASQGISGLLRLFASWAHSSEYVGYLGEYDPRVPGVMWQALSAGATPDQTKLFILNDIVLPWASLAEDESHSPNKARDLFRIESDGLLTSLAALLERTPPRLILAAVTTVLPKVAPFVESAQSRQSIIKLLTTLLSDDGLKIAPNVKGQLLLSVHNFLAVDASLDQTSHLQLLTLISSLFNFFKDEPNRQVLCELLERLSTSDQSLAQIAQLCKDMNAMSSQRLEEIDYDTRLRAFQSIQTLELTNIGSMYQPIVCNLVFFLRTSEDFTIRSNALECLKQMIIKSQEIEGSDLNDSIVSTVLPVIKRCLVNESESVRADFVTLLGLMVQHTRNNGDLTNMTPLLVGNDEEASFFSNILHIQQHRRLRAIRRLVSEVEKGLISPTNIVDIFIPLLTMFAHDSGTDESVQTAKGQSITAIGTLLQWIDWKHFKVLFRRYKNELNVTGDDQKASNRLLACAADALISADSHRLEGSTLHQGRPVPELAASLPDKATVQEELRHHFIPRLAELVHYKDEAEISFRVPIAVVALKLITLLPLPEIPLLAAPVTLNVAQILRSRAQESRDAARKALCQIVLLLGPGSLQFVVGEMRSALKQGYQLHVVSYTLHAILVALVPQSEHGDLDYCCEELASVIMDDIFGVAGQEKDNHDYVSSMREVKSSKSFDSMELLARSINVSSVSKLVAPIQTILSGTLSAKQVRQVDDLLRRIGSGLSMNPSAGQRDVLTFAYQLIQGLYQQKETSQSRILTNDERNRQRYLVELSSAGKSTPSQNSALSYKIAKFALDLVRTTFQRYPEVLIAENVHGFLPIIGDALIEGQEDVRISALRLLSAIVKLSMPELDQDSPFYIGEAIKIVRNSSSTNEEGAQAALKLIAAILRERRSVEVKASDVAELLHRVAPDIEAPDRQGVTFNFIRAVMARKIQLPELYDLADKIGVMTVTNHSKGARDVARGIFVHFLLEYPQSTSRWSKQQKFLMENLQYEHSEGRQSVMETINTLIGKMKGEAAQEFIYAFFIPILLQMVNDDKEECRQLAGVLLGRLFTLAERSRLKDIFDLLNGWFEQEEDVKLKKVSMQAYGILLDTNISLTQDEVDQIGRWIAKSLEATPVTETDEDGWEVRFQSLGLLSKLVGSHPANVLSQERGSLWSQVWSSLVHPNAWIQSTSASLIIQFFSHCASADRSKLPLTCDHGLCLKSEELVGILKAATRILRCITENVDLSAQMEQILLFLGQCLNENSLSIEVNQKPVEGQSSEGQENEGQELEETGSEETDSEDEVSAEESSATIPAIQYLLDQLARNIRTETVVLTSAALLPKKASLRLLSNLIPILSMANLPNPQVHAILLPLQHLTDTNTNAPRSADPTFGATYQNLIELAHEVMEKLQKKLGDAEYVKAVTEVSKMVRERREERRTKRRIESVADPEKAARDKKRKSDRKKERTKEIGRAHQKRRMEGGM